MKSRPLAFLTLAWMVTSLCPAALALEKQGLRVLYLARNDADRTQAFEIFLNEHFEGVLVVAREEFEPAMARGVDVAVIDWPQSERLTGAYESPLGSLEDWNLPTVFLGSAGLQMAGPWNVIGGAG